MFTDADLMNIIKTCEHSLDLVGMISKYGGHSPIQDRAAVSLIQAKCEQELMKRRAAEEARMDAGGEEPEEVVPTEEPKKE